VATSLASEGLDVMDGRHVVLADTDAQLAASIVRLLRDRDFAVRVAREGRKLVRERYSWEANFAGLKNWLALIALLPRRAAGSEQSKFSQQPKQAA
jgi:hypothetical protein